MRTETSVWLEPMLTAAETRGIDMQALIRQASMPAREADSASVQWLASYAPPEARASAIDWIRFGQLLRDALGWSDYPQDPGVALS